MTTWVLLRGLAREARHWGDFAAALQGGLPEGDRVVALDLPGNGRLWQQPSPSRIEGLLDAARRELAAMRCEPPYVPVALSLGGMVALHWAMHQPQELRGCVLINTSLGRFSPFWQRLRPGSYGGLLRLWFERDALRSEAGILRLTSNRPDHQHTAHDWSGYARECPVRRANVLRQLLAAARFHAPDQAPAVPALLLAAEADRFVGVACSRAIARAWGLPLEVHPHAGHDLPLDDPGWLIARIGAWERGLPR